MRKILAIGTGVFVAVMAFASSAMAAGDTNLSAQTDSVKQYFTDNIGTVIALFVGIAAFLWLLGMALKSVGVSKKKSVA